MVKLVKGSILLARDDLRVRTVDSIEDVWYRPNRDSTFGGSHNGVGVSGAAEVDVLAEVVVAT